MRNPQPLPVTQSLAYDSLMSYSTGAGMPERIDELGEGFEHLINASRVQFPMEMAPPRLHTRGGDELTVVSSEYLEVIAVKA